MHSLIGNERVGKDIHSMQSPGFSDEIAPVITWLCSDSDRWVSGANMPVDGGLAFTYV